MEITVLMRSLKSSNCGVVSAAVEQSGRKANMVAQGEGKLGPRGWPQNPFKPKKLKLKDKALAKIQLQVKALN